jgi:peptidyl-prolyl cis-trans isomerase C
MCANCTVGEYTGFVKKAAASLLLCVLAGASAASCRKPPAPESNTTTPAPGAAPASGPAGAAATTPAPPKPMPPQLPDVLARVNGEPVQKAEFDRVIRNLELSNGPIPPERRDEVLRNALDQLITYTLMTQEAKTQNVIVADAEIEARINQMRGPGSEADFKKALDARNMTLDQLRSDARVQLTIEKMMNAQVAGIAAATDTEARDFYAKNPDKFKQADTVRASHILLRVDPKTPDAARKQARTRIESLLKRARSGEDFAALAKQHSQDGSARQGGDLGYFEREAMVPAFSQAAFSLKPGELSDIVTTDFGYHIIKVMDRKAAATVPYEQVSAQIVDFLSKQKKQQRASQFIDETRKRARIEVLV